MSDKVKRKSHPRRRLLIRLILGIGIVMALIVMIVKQFEPEHLYLVYESHDEETLAPNLYLYDATTGETVRQITSNTDSDRQLYFDTSENAPYIVYQYQSLDEMHPLVLIDLKTGNEEILADRDTIHANFSIHPDGDYVAYQLNSSDEERLLTYRVNRSKPHRWNTGIVHDYDYGIVDNDAYGGTSVLNWSDESLTITYFSESNHTIYTSPLPSGRTTHLIDTPIRYGYDFPGLSSDGLLISYSAPENGSDLRIINSNDSSLTHLSLPVLEDSWDLIGSSNFDAWRPGSHDLFVWIGNPYSEPPPEADSLSSIYLWSLAVLNADTNEILDLSDGRHYSQTSPAWNADGSYLLYVRNNVRCEGIYADCSETIIYDMESGEEIALSLFGFYPQWVNGGR